MNIPDIESELNRKTLEAIRSLLSSLAEGRLTESEVSVAFTALWNAVSGLVSQEVMDNITEVSEGCEKGSETFMVMQRGDRKLLLIHKHWYQLLDIYDLGSLDLLSQKTGSQAIQATLKAFEAKGFERVL